MINLLPSEKLAEVQAEYRRRRRLVAGGLILAWLSMASIVAFSGYISARFQGEVTAKALTTKQLEMETESRGEGASAANLSDELALLLAAGRARLSPSSYLSHVLEARPAGVSFTSFNLSVGEGGETA
jgi:hypothetical protein